MKTAVSVPNDVFEKAERLAKREGRSRSDVYSSALREYVARHSPEELTASIDAALAELGDAAISDGFVRAAAAATLRSTKW
jgi:metal-responsive CopG/Arc/MetJ family transcriptional regulator